MSSGQKQQTEALSRSELPATGERFVTQNMGEHIQVAYEHLHRYLLAQECCRGKSVLDIASGEGYGSNILAQSAKSVVGVDISAEAIQFAQQKYKRPNLRFSKGDCTRIPVGKHSVDVVVSFETIEHILQQEAFIIEIRRVLRPGGLLIISSPDKHEYSDRSGYTNPFHVAELYRSDFLRLLKRHFKNCRSLQQRLVAGSYIAADPDNQTGVVYGTHRGNLLGGTFNEGVHEGLYSVAVCSDSPLPEVLAGIFENRAESARIWHAFEELDNVRADMETLRGYLEDERMRLRECEAEKVRAQTHYKELALRYDHVEAQLRKQHEESTAQILTLQNHARELDQEAIARGEWGKRLDGEIEALRAIVAEQRTALAKLEQSHTEKDIELNALRAGSFDNTQQLQSHHDELAANNNQLTHDLGQLSRGVAELELELGQRQETVLRYEQKILELENRHAALLGEQEQAQLRQATLQESQNKAASELTLQAQVHDTLKNKLGQLETVYIEAQSRIGSLEANEIHLKELQNFSQQAAEDLSQKLAALDKEKSALQTAQAELNSKLRLIVGEKDQLLATVQSLEKEKNALLNSQNLQQTENHRQQLELGTLKSEAESLRGAQTELLSHIKQLEAKSLELDQARELATRVANESQNLLEQFFQQLSRSLETARSEITCLNLTQLIHVKDSETSATPQSPMQTELCTFKNQSEDILHQLESDQKTTSEQLKQAALTVQSLSQEKEALKALVGRMNADWAEAEQQVLDAQSQLWQILTEAEAKLHWAASLDKDLCSMRKAVVERDEMLEKQKAKYEELEEQLRQARALVSEKDARIDTLQAETLSKSENLAASQAKYQAHIEQLQRDAEAQAAAAKEALEKRLSEVSQEAGETKQQLAHIKASFAWKASAPLRMFNKDLSEKKTT